MVHIDAVQNIQASASVGRHKCNRLRALTRFAVTLRQVHMHMQNAVHKMRAHQVATTHATHLEFVHLQAIGPAVAVVLWQCTACAHQSSTQISSINQPDQERTWIS